MLYQKDMAVVTWLVTELVIAVRGEVLKYMSLMQRVDFVMKDGVVFKQDGIVNEQLLPENLRLK